MALTSRELRDAFQKNGDIEIIMSQIEESLSDENLSNNQRNEIEKLKDEIYEKYPDLKPKTEDASNEKELSQPIRIQEDVLKDREYMNLVGNEAKREFVINEFRNGIFSDQSHMLFYLEQYTKGEIIPDEKDMEKLNYLLSGEVIRDRVSSIEESILKNEASPRTYLGTGDTRGIMSDLDIGAAIREDKAKKVKDDLDSVIENARNAAAQRKLDGDLKKHIEAKTKAEEALKDSKWWRFRRNAQLRNAIVDIDPVGYYRQQSNASTDGISKMYYEIRASIAGRDENRFERLGRRLDRVTELQARDAGARWLSTKFFDKLKTKAELLVRRSPEKLMEKMVKTGNITSLSAYLDKYKENQESIISSLPKGTKLQQNAHLQRTQMLDSVSDKLKEGIKSYEDQLGELSLPDRSADQGRVIMQSYVERLESQVKKIQSSYNAYIERDPVYLAAVKLHGEDEAKKLFSKKFTKEEVLTQIAKDQGYESIKEFLIARGVKESEAESVAAAILKESGKNNDRANSEEQEDKTKENETPESQDTVENKGFGAKDSDAKELILDDKTNTQLASDLSKDGWNKEGDGSIYSRVGDDGKKQTIEFLYNPENKKYSMNTLDADGNKRDATKEDYVAMAKAMYANGTTSVTITDLPAAELEMARDALEKAGIVINNGEDVERRIQAHKEEKAAEEQKTKEKEENSEGSPKPVENEEESPVIQVEGESKTSSKGEDGKVETTKKDDINLVNVTNYIKGLRLDGRTDMETKGEKTVKFRDLNDEEKKLAKQLHAHRMNIIKQAKAKGLSEKDIEAAATAGTVAWLKGRLSGTKSTPKRKKQINDLAKANVSVAMKSKSGNESR